MFYGSGCENYIPEKFGDTIKAITDEGPPELLTMDYARMVCILWKVVQNHEERIKALEKAGSEATSLGPRSKNVACAKDF